jgi:hypothetical protein
MVIPDTIRANPEGWDTFRTRLVIHQVQIKERVKPQGEFR